MVPPPFLRDRGKPPVVGNAPGLDVLVTGDCDGMEEEEDGVAFAEVVL